MRSCFYLDSRPVRTYIDIDGLAVVMIHNVHLRQRYLSKTGCLIDLVIAELFTFDTDRLIDIRFIFSDLTR